MGILWHRLCLVLRINGFILVSSNDAVMCVAISTSARRVSSTTGPLSQATAGQPSQTGATETAGTAKKCSEVIGH